MMDIETRKKAAVSSIDSELKRVVAKKKANRYYEWFTSDLEEEIDALTTEVARIEKLLEDLKLVDSDKGDYATIVNTEKLRVVKEDLKIAKEQLELRKQTDILSNQLVEISKPYDELLKAENKKYEETMAKLK